MEREAFNKKKNVDPKASLLFLCFFPLNFDTNDREQEDFIGNPYKSKHVEDVGGIGHLELHSYMPLL